MRILWGEKVLAPDQGEAISGLSNEIQRVIDTDPQTRATHPTLFSRGNELRVFGFTIDREWPDLREAQDFIIRMDSVFAGTELQTLPLRIRTDGAEPFTVFLEKAALQRYSAREEGVSTLQTFRFLVASNGTASTDS